MNLRINKSYIILIVAGIALVFIFLFLAVYFLLKPSGNNESLENITPSSFPNAKQSSIKARTEPREDTSGETIKNPSQRITFNLTDQVPLSAVIAQVDPEIPIKMSLDQSGAIVVYPDPPEYWRPDVLYTITLRERGGNVISTYKIKVPEFIPKEVLD